MSDEPLDALSDLEKAILFAVIRQTPDAYGLSIHDDVTKRLNRNIPIGTIYTKIERLESKKYITSRAGEPVAKRGGRRKLYFTINGLGRKALSRSLQDLNNANGGILVSERGL